MPVMSYLTTCIFDHGAIGQIGGALKGAKASRPFVVTDAGVRAAGILDKLLAALPGPPAAIYAETPSNPTESAARSAVALFKESGADSLIGIGGGSSMDMAKAVGLMATHEGPYGRYGARVGGAKLIGPIPPLIAIPTTAGTGSEVSVGFVVILDDGRKETIVSPRLVPTTAICDPALTLGLPPGLTAATGMDAVTHCVEAVLSPRENPPADGIGLDGIERAVGWGWLEKAVADGTDADARWHMMMASYEGALAFVKGLGAVHGLSHALGRNADLKLHHGTLNAVILPHALAMIEEAGAAGEKLARIRRAMHAPEGARLSEAVAALNARIGIPRDLSALGVTQAHLASNLDYAVTDLATASNAIPFDADAYVELFRRSL
jgi:alcohol dehydrogenase class IV